MDDLDALVQEWRERSGRPEIGWRTYVGILLGIGENERAEREALRLSPEDPLLVHRVRLVTRSMSDAPRMLLGAVDSARRVADLTDSALERATALVRAGEILYELSVRADENLSRNLKQEADRVFSAAVSATSDARRETGDKRVDHACEMLLARILLCNGDPKEQERARRLVETRLETRGEDFDLRIALIRNLLRFEATKQSREPSDDGSLHLAALEHARKMAEPVKKIAGDSGTTPIRTACVREVESSGGGLGADSDLLPRSP